MIQVAVVDHVGKTVTATIHSSFNNSQVTLFVNQTARKIGAECSNLVYQVYFPRASQEYKLTLHAEGPCKSKGISSLAVDITFSTVRVDLDSCKKT